MGDIIANSSEVVQVITNTTENVVPLIFENLSFLIKIIQAIGIVLIIYILYYALSVFFEYRNRKRIKRIEEKVDNLDKKIDKLLKKRR